MNRGNRNSQKGIALLVVLFAMVLVAAIGLAMMFASNGDTGVNGVYRQSNLSFFAARSGVEELRDRMRLTSTDPNSNGWGLNDFLPTVSIGLPGGVLYVTNPANGEVVTPWTTTVNGADNPYFDDELCHEIANPAVIPNSPGAPNRPCSKNAPAQIPTAGVCPGATCWYTQVNAETLPNNASLTYKWSRINLKLNESTNPWCVLRFGTAGCGQQAGPDPSADQVCYNGQNEFVLSDLKTPIDVPGRVEGEGLPSQLALAMYMYGGGSTAHGTGGHSGTAATGTSTSTSTSGGTSTSTTGGTSTSGTSGTSGSTSGSTGTSGTSSSSSSTGIVGTTTGTSSSSSSSSTGLIGTTTGSSSSSSTGLIGTTAGSSSSSSSTTGSSSSGSSSSSTSGTSGSSTGVAGTGGTTPGPSCGVNSPPLPGTPFGVGTTPVQAVSCKAVQSEPVYLLTALAVAPGTGARRMVQYEVARIPVPPVPAALTIAGPLVNPVASNSNNYFIDGHDVPYDAVNQCGGMDKPAVGTISDTGNAGATQSMNNFINAIPSSRRNNYTGADGCSPDVQNVDGISNTMYSTPQGLQGLVQTVQGAATQTYPSNPTITNWGTANNPEVIVVNGDVNISAATGYGVLLVTGSLTFSGNFAWNGLVLVVGQGELHEQGGGNKGIDGALLLAKIGNANYSTNPTDANLLSQLGSPIYDYPGGGTAGFKYDSCMIKSITGKSNFTVLARREITY